MVGCGMASLDVSARMAAEEESKMGQDGVQTDGGRI